MKFKVLIGRHQDVEKNIYEAGEIVETDTDLVLAFGEKFQAVIEAAPVPKTKEVKSKSTAEIVDVSDDFDLDYNEEGLRIIKRGRNYFVCIDGEEVNPKGLTKKTVPSFLSDYFG